MSATCWVTDPRKSKRNMTVLVLKGLIVWEGGGLKYYM